MLKRLIMTFLSLTLIASQSSAAMLEASNQIVVMIDCSKTYAGRFGDAMKRSVEMIGDLSEQQVDRWKREQDRVTIVSLDAMPTVIYEGTVADLKKRDPSFWTARVNSRSDYSSCSDVSAAFNIAAAHLDGDPRTTSKYAIVFSDLIDEKASASLTKCVPPKTPSPPPEDFPWSSLIGVSVTVFWMPPSQILPWHRAIELNSLDETFKIYSTSESASVELIAPPKAQLSSKIQEEIDRTERTEIIEKGKTAASWIAGILVGFALLIAAGFWLSRRQKPSSRRGTGSPVGQNRQDNSSPLTAAPSDSQRPPRVDDRVKVRQMPLGNDRRRTG